MPTQGGEWGAAWGSGTTERPTLTHPTITTGVGGGEFSFPIQLSWPRPPPWV